MNVNGQAPSGHPQQMPSNAQLPAGNMGPRSLSIGSLSTNMGYRNSNMAPPAGNMGPPIGSTGSHPVNMGPPGGMRLPTGNTGLPTGNMHPSTTDQIPPMPSRPTGTTPNQNFNRTNPPPTQIPPPHSSGDFYLHNPTAITPAKAPIHQPIRNTTFQMLTHNHMSEMSVINHYQQEIEYLRVLQMDRFNALSREGVLGWIHQCVRNVNIGVSVQSVESVLRFHGLISQQAGFSGGVGGGGQRPVFQQGGSQQSGVQQGGLGVQQPGHRGVSGSEQPLPAPSAVEGPVAAAPQQPPPEQEDAKPVVEPTGDKGLLPSPVEH